jgi:hypothetical protein
VDDGDINTQAVIHRENGMPFQESDQSIAEALRDLIAGRQAGNHLDIAGDHGTITIAVSPHNRVGGTFDIKITVPGATEAHYDGLLHLESVFRGAYNLGIVVVPAGKFANRAGGYQRRYAAAPMKTIVNDLSPADRERFNDRQPLHPWLTRRVVSGPTSEAEAGDPNASEMTEPQ